MSKKRNKNSRKKKLKSRLSHSLDFHTAKRYDVLASLDYQITNEPIDNDDIRALPDKIQERMLYLHDFIRIKPLEAINELTSLIRKYPHIPTLYNFLYRAHAHSHQNEEAEKIIVLSYEIFPSYLFAKLDYVDYLVRHGELKKATEVYGDQFKLTSLYPGRDKFHKSEVICFNGVTGYYHTMVGQYRNAIPCLDVLTAISPLHEYTMRLLKKMDGLSKFATC